MIKAIIFDVAGVMTTLEDPLMPKIASKKYGVDAKLFKENMEKCFRQFDAGRITEKIFMERLFRAVKKPVDYGWFKNKIKYKKSKPAVIKFVKKLSKEIPVYALTNEGSEYWKRIEKKCGIGKAVRKVYASYMFNSRKPSRRIFHEVLKRIKRKPSEVLFFDDTMRHVKGARKAGLNAEQFTTLQKCRKDLKKFGISNTKL